jgi:TolA-binding protein
MRAGRPGAVLALLLLALPCFADQAGDLLVSGRKALADGQYSLAEGSFRRLSTEYPESPSSPEAELLLGVALFYQGNWPDALDTLRAFRGARPDSSLQTRASYWMAASCLKLGRYADALGYLDDRPARPGEGDPYRFPALLAQGAALEGLGRDAEAAAAYEKILADPAASSYLAEAVFRMAGAELRTGRYAAARDLYARLLLDYPTSPFVADAVFFLAECGLPLGSLDEAEKGYRSLLSLYPDSPWREAASFRLADVAWRRRKADVALDLLASLHARYPDGAWRGSALRLGADIRLSGKKYAEAADGYARALPLLKDGPEKQSAWYSLGVAQLALGQKKKAAESFANAGSAAAGRLGEKAAWDRAVILAGAGSGADAIPALQGFLQSFPSTARKEEARRLLASLLDTAGRPAEALPVWDALVNGLPRPPSLPEYLFRRGSDFLALDRPSDALDDFQRVAREWPKSAWRNESAYSIGWVYDQRGEYPRALPWFQSVGQDPKAGEVGERSRLSAGICLFNMGSFDKAVSSLRALRAGKPKTVPEGTIVLYLGRALYRGEHLAEAADTLAEAVELLAPAAAGAADPGAESSVQAAEAQYWRGWSLLRLRRLDDARTAFLSVADRFPSSGRTADALLRAGTCETMRGDDESAAGLFERVLGVPGGEPSVREQALYERHGALVRLGRGDDSESTLGRLVAEFPAGALAPQAVYDTAEQALRDHRFSDARSGFLRVARDFPSSALAAQSLYWSADADRQAGDLEAALAGYWNSLGTVRGALLDTVLGSWRDALVSLGSLETARSYAAKAKAAKGLPPAAAAAIELTAAEMLLAGSPEEALDLVNDARRRAPPEPWTGQASLLLGMYCETVGDADRAAGIFAALEGPRADEVGARAALGHGRALEAAGHASEAIDQYVKVSYQFPDFPAAAAEGLYSAVRLARARGERDRAARIEQMLRTGYPASPWVERLAPPGGG